MEHPGIVTALKPGIVTVQIESTSACAACEAHSRCGFAESKTKTLDIPVASLISPTPIVPPFEGGRGVTISTDEKLNDTLKVGDRVTVTIDHSRGLLATWWAYVLPALLLLGAIVGFSLASLPEPVVILLSLAILALYTLALFLLRRRLDSKFTLTISPLTQ